MLIAQDFYFRYFIVPEKLTGSISNEEASMYGDSANYIFASNGWVMGDDPLRNFAEPCKNYSSTHVIVKRKDSKML